MADHEVYLPVMVTLEGDNHGMVSINVEFEGAPWMYVATQENVWAINAHDDDGEWIRDESIEARAIDQLQAVLTAWQQAQNEGAHT